MSKISKLNELKNLVRVEKIRITDEVIAELRAGSFDIEDFSAGQALEIARDHVEGKIFYQEECRSEALYGWDGLWTREDKAKLEQLRDDLDLVTTALKKADEAFNAKMPF
jgi:hypothetical protein